MKPASRHLVIAVSMLACGLWASGQEPPACSPAQSAGGPCIDKIDPPGWWAGLPDPMLLVHGEGLNHARFALNGTGVTLDRTQASENGHWAFLWLETKSAAPQTVWITASNDQGQSRRSYVLAERSHQADGHSGFSSSDVLYLIMTDRFAAGTPANDPPGDDRAAARGWHGGDLAGIEQHLDYLKQLGVTAVWTTPVASNGTMPEAYHGYAATDLYAVDPHFGTLTDYEHLSDALHARGMKLVIDLVPNHIGVKHPWVLDPPAPDWFHATLEHHSAVKSDFYQLVDPHAPPQAWRNITDGWFTDDMPDLNQENPLVSRYLIQNALWWVETANLDGIRLDTFPYVDRAFWHDFHAELHSVYPRLTTVGEVMDRDPEITSFFAGGVARRGIDTGLDTPFDYPVCFALRDVLAHGKPMTELAKVLRQDSLYSHPERLVTFIGNHDTTRFLTEAGSSLPSLKLAVGLILTLRGMPQIYSGDEIGMTGGADPDNRHDFPGGFPGDAHNGFTRVDRTATEQQIFTWTSGMLALRASHPALETGLEQDLFADDDVFAFVRTSDAGSCSSGHSSDASQERLLIVVNKARHIESLELPVDGTALAGCTKFQVMAPATGTVPVAGGGKLHIEEPAESITVYEVQ
ncbi:MAG: alpha-amylase family glycosyl hydrolase [Acidobacteriota bacterium]|nr:alpha-amylase family glycosyl hydrolase [Acidobacteriota bacterium]